MRTHVLWKVPWVYVVNGTYKMQRSFTRKVSMLVSRMGIVCMVPSVDASASRRHGVNMVV